MVVEYADKYGVNNPISLAQSVPPETQNAANCNQWSQEGQQQQENPTFDLAALIQDATSNFGGHKNDNAFMSDAYMTDMGERDGLQDIGKLLEQRLSSHKPEFHQEPQGQTTSEVASDPAIPNGLASLIAGSLADGLDKVPDGLPNMTMPSFTMTNHHTAHGTCPCPLLMSQPVLILVPSNPLTVQGTGGSASRSILPIVRTRFCAPFAFPESQWGPVAT